MDGPPSEHGTGAGYSFLHSLTSITSSVMCLPEVGGIIFAPAIFVVVLAIIISNLIIIY
jgi:hypothetical protein